MINDKRIEELCEGIFPLIAPFNPFKVSEIDKVSVISYGLSGAGYDLTLKNEFKVPITVNKPIDPKNVYKNLYNKVVADVIIVEPNNYILGVAKEHLDLPDTVSGVCLTKSTYARCFTGDTQIALLNRKKRTLEKMALEWERTGESYWGYGVNQSGLISATELTHPRYIGTDSLLEITLDNGEIIKCTPDHTFMKRYGDRDMIQANDLRPGDSMFPLYRKVVDGYEKVYQPTIGFLEDAHRLPDRWNLLHGIYEETPNTHRHHIDHNRRNNAPSNILRVDAIEHIKYHNLITYGEGFDPALHGKRVSDSVNQKMKDIEYAKRHRKRSQNAALIFWHDPSLEDQRKLRNQRIKESWTPERRALWSKTKSDQQNTPEAKQQRSELSKLYWENASQERHDRQSEIFLKNMELAGRYYPDITDQDVLNALEKSGTIQGAAKLLGVDRSVFRRFDHILSTFETKNPQAYKDIDESLLIRAMDNSLSIDEMSNMFNVSRSTIKRRISKIREQEKTLNNHKIVSIRELKGTHDVYCLTSETENFALSSGIIAHNCGIFLNMTPIEPGWKGHLTLEIANLSKSPVMVYANEGICQILFFEHGQSTTYGQGKYQNQPAEPITARMKHE